MTLTRGFRWWYAIQFFLGYLPPHQRERKSQVAGVKQDSETTRCASDILGVGRDREYRPRFRNNLKIRSFNRRRGPGPREIRNPLSASCKSVHKIFRATLSSARGEIKIVKYTPRGCPLICPPEIAATRSTSRKLRGNLAVSVHLKSHPVGLSPLAGRRDVPLDISATLQVRAPVRVRSFPFHEVYRDKMEFVCVEYIFKY